MNTHKGLFRYTRLIYGISTAAAIFQCTMDKILLGIPNIIYYIDDILCFGKDFTSCKKTLVSVLHRLDKYNVRLKLVKCIFFQSKIKFLGQVIPNGTRTTSPKKLLLF